MLRELHLTNFKSFAADATPIPFAPVTLLVGANASGKSNVLDALRFLQGVGMGLSVSEILQGKWEGGREVFPALRGGATGVCWRGGEEFAIETTLDGPSSKDFSDQTAIKSTLRHDIRCNSEGVVVESLEATESNGTRKRHYFKTFKGQSPIPRSSLAGEPERGEEDGNDAMNRTEKVYFGEHLLRKYRQMRFLDIRPSLMRDYVPMGVPDLGDHGENLSAIVRRICLSEKDGKKQRYIDWLSALCAPQVKDIHCEEDASKKRVMAFLVEGDKDSKPLSLRCLSDGTLRFMGLLAAMFTAPEGSVFLLEEIENGLHPTRIHLLVELFEQFAESRNLQIIATTHSSQVLLSLSEKALGDAILFARPEETQGTVTSRLGDLDDFDEVVRESKIDRLFTTGWLERAL